MIKKHFTHIIAKPHQSCLKVAGHYFSTFAVGKLKWLWCFSKSLVTNAGISEFLYLPWEDTSFLDFKFQE